MPQLRHTKRKPTCRAGVWSSKFLSSDRCLRSGRANGKTGRAEAVQHPVIGADVNAAVGDRQAAEMVPRLDLIAARPQLFTGLAVEGVEHGVRGPLNPSLAATDVSGFGPPLRRALTAAVRIDHAVCDHGRIGHVHVTRNPRGNQRRLSGLRIVYDLERGNGAIHDLTV